VRFYVREHTGYTITTPGRPNAGNGRPVTECMVIDAAECSSRPTSRGWRTTMPSEPMEDWSGRHHSRCAGLRVRSGCL
jgi:hypothetical protein